MATFSANKGRVSLNTPSNGQVVAVFSEAKISGEPKTYAQNFVNATLGNPNFETPGNTVTLYPNPSNGIVNIKAGTNIKTINVVDMLGQTVYRNAQVDELETAINVTTWAKGIYIITTETNTTKPVSFKFVKS